MAQEPKLDSIGQLLEETRRNSIAKVNTLMLMSKELLSIDPEKALIYSQQGLLIAERLNYRKGISDALYYIASSYLNLEAYPKALSYYLRALKFYQSMGQLSGQATSLQSIGQIYLKFGDYEKALEYQLKAIRVYEQVGDKGGEAASIDNLGNIYMAYENYEKAIELFTRALELSQSLNAPSLKAISLRNLAEAYLKTKKYTQAAELFQQAINLFNKTSNQPKNLAKAYYGLGRVQKIRNRDNEALSLFLKALDIQKSTLDQEGISHSYLSIADLYIQTQNTTRAIDYLNQSLEIAQKLRYKELLKDIYQKLSLAHEKLDMLPEAFNFYKLHKVYSDSIYNEARLALITEMQMRYELQIKERENQEQKQRIRLLTQERVRQDASIVNKDRNIRLQNGIIGLFIGISILIALLAFVIYQSKLRGSKANIQLQKQNAEINRQKVEIEKQSKQLELALLNISDSIRYAETIQKSILPSQQKMDLFLKDYFIISRPKNIVSGDFYWISKIEDKIVVAVVDCTGHGVPGGFTSMIGHTLLNEIVNQDKILDPSEVLTLLNQGVINVIEKQMQEIGIGMEVCLAILEPQNDESNLVKIKYAGAKRPLFSIRNNGLPMNQQSIQEIRGDREPIGFVLNSERVYTQQEIILEKGSLLYFTTDGFVDQANMKNKRFGTTKFKQFLRQNALYDLPTQKKQLEKVFSEYSQNAIQRDDITILGLRI
ncbi:MAG: tetratricopeptide repeat protein [Microscillaceae bacterium]|nr:tetratricopeptide repeat protein [Microscillaceae bacterium]